MKIILIGNYPPDKQESMRLFTEMLDKGFRDAGHDTAIWLPKVVFGSLSSNTNAGLGKWLGYIDKWILFPLYLRMKRMTGNYKESTTRFHVCDHSNSPYLAHLPPAYTAITCHDVLAIRGAFGFKDAYCEASRMGLILQKWILRNLLKAGRLASVSMFTMRQLIDLSPRKGPSPGQEWRVILNAFNQDFYPVQAAAASERLPALGISPHIPYVLHVGSSLPRKNRKLLVEMMAALGNRWDGHVCFAGQDIDSELMMLIEKHGLQSRVRTVVNPKHDDLVILYSACAAFVFPSYSEGFGWPVIEAQACGAPVITSNIEPMPEVSGGAALHADPDNAAEFADAFLSLADSKVKEDLLKKGFENSMRFAPQVMINFYLDLHKLTRNN